jgi:glycosyltransferase involved in cell wall biosynthesis
MRIRRKEPPGDDGGNSLPRAGSHLSPAWAAAHDRHRAERRILRWTKRATCRLARQVICISKSLREVAIAEGLCPPEKIKALGRGSIDGIDADRKFNPARISTESARLVRDRYQIPEGALLVGFVGRIVRDKGLIELAQAWRALREDCSSLHLLVVGPFESQDPIPADVEATLRSDPRKPSKTASALARSATD